MNNPFDSTVAPQADASLPPGQRPTSATVFGIINLVFGGIGLCGGIFSLGTNLVPGGSELVPTDPWVKSMQDPSYPTFMIVVGIVGLVATALLITSGIGLLKFKPWGRSTANIYAVLALFMLVVNTVFMFILLVGPMLANAQTQEQHLVAGVMVGSSVVGAVVGIIYPVLLLFFMNRRTFREMIAA